MVRSDESTAATGASDEIENIVTQRLDVAELDVYLGPHCDDICFSLGAHAHRRQSGLLLTVCAIGGYIAIPGKTVAEITEIRLREETVFARSCGLVAAHIAIEGASVLGHDPFDADWLAPNTERIEPRLLAALSGLAARRTSAARPWLFCPSGIGGHIDHLAVRDVIVRHAAHLRGLYRLAFYEDLHYASEAEKRVPGVENLQRAVPDPRLRRFVLPVAERYDIKLGMLRLYPSQLPEPPSSMAAFTPAVEPGTPHEAVWTAEPAGPNA